MYRVRVRVTIFRCILAQDELQLILSPTHPLQLLRAEVAVMYPCECRGSHDASPLQRQPRCIPTEWWSRDASLRTWAMPACAEDWGRVPQFCGVSRRHPRFPGRAQRGHAAAEARRSWIGAAAYLRAHILILSRVVERKEQLVATTRSVAVTNCSFSRRGGGWPQR